MSEQTSKQMSAMERASEATSADQANELNEHTDEPPAKHLRRDTWCSLRKMKVGKCENEAVVFRWKNGVLFSTRRN